MALTLPGGWELQETIKTRPTHQPRRIGTKEIKVGNIQAAQIIANADLGHNNTELRAG